MFLNYYDSYKGISPSNVIARELNKRKITQRQFSDQIGMHYQTLNAIIKGHRKLTLEQSLRIENALGLEEGLLMTLQLHIDIAALKSRSVNPSIQPPEIRKAVFWDTDISEIDWNRHRTFIINRVTERGNDDEKRKVAIYYNLKEI